jgi:hypothetical protein
VTYQNLPGPISDQTVTKSRIWSRVSSVISWTWKSLKRSLSALARVLDHRPKRRGELLLDRLPAPPRVARQARTSHKTGTAPRGGRYSLARMNRPVVAPLGSGWPFISAGE